DEAVAKGGADHAPNRQLSALGQRGRGVPEVARPDIRDECQIPLWEGVVEVEIRADSLDSGGGGALTEYDRGDVPRQDLDRREDQKRCDKQRDDSGRNPPDDESSNWVSLLPSRRAVTVGRAARGCRWRRSRVAAHAARREIRLPATRT